MKYFILALFLGSAVQAAPKEDPECQDIKYMDFRIVQRFDQHTYEMSYVHVSTRHSLLLTKRAVFSSAAPYPMGIGVKFVGVQKLPLSNGFSGSFEVYRECKVIPMEWEKWGPLPGMRQRLKEDF